MNLPRLHVVGEAGDKQGVDFVSIAGGGVIVFLRRRGQVERLVRRRVSHTGEFESDGGESQLPAEGELGMFFVNVNGI